MLIHTSIMIFHREVDTDSYEGRIWEKATLGRLRSRLRRSCTSGMSGQRRAARHSSTTQKRRIHSRLSMRTISSPPASASRFGRHSYRYRVQPKSSRRTQSMRQTLKQKSEGPKLLSIFLDIKRLALSSPTTLPPPSYSAHKKT